MTDDETVLNNWFMCPWCRSDEPADGAHTEPENTELYVHVPDDIGGDVGLSVRCHSCGTDVSWDLTVGETPEVYARD